MQLVGYVVYRVQAFSGIHRSSIRSLRWQRETYKCLCRHTWFAAYKPLVTNRVVYNPLVDYVDRCLKAFGRLRRSSFAVLWWHTWIVVCKPLVPYVDICLQAFGGLSGSPARSLWWQMVSFTSLWWHTWIVVCKLFGGVRGSSCESLWWHTWLVVCTPLVAYVDRRSHAFGGRYSRLQAFGGIRGFSCISFWWHTWIVVHKHLVAYGAIYKPLVLYVDRRLQAFGGYFCGSLAFSGRWSRLQAFGSLRGSPFASLWWQMESFTSLWWHAWNVVHKHLVADGALLKPLVVYVDRRLQANGG